SPRRSVSGSCRGACRAAAAQVSAAPDRNRRLRASLWIVGLASCIYDTAATHENESGRPWMSARDEAMSAPDEACQTRAHRHRRTFLSASFALGAVGFVGAGAFSGIAYAQAMTKAKRDKLSPDDVLALMKKGNKRFVAGRRQDHNFLAQQRASAAGQYPVAVLLSCIDSRAPAET